jgi:hypothetical protein
MSSDRELLEAAARAAGLPECGWMGPAFTYVKNDTFVTWNPLTDDGDALRLAVKLRLDIEHGSMLDNSRYVCVSRTGIEMVCSPVMVIQEFEDENCELRLAATRLAIVRAAASIGASHV